MMRVFPFAGALVLCLLTAVATAQQPAPADEDEQMDDALRKLGYAAGLSSQCQTQPAEKARIERQALDVANGILRLFGANRAFYFAAAFGAGVTADVDRQQCADIIKQYEAMVAKLRVLAGK